MLNRLFSTVGGQLFGKVLVLVNSILFARILGPNDFGEYSYVISIITVLTLPIVAGVPNLIIREVAKYSNGNDYLNLKSVLNWTRNYIIITSSLIIIVSYVSIHLVDIHSDMKSLFFLGLFLLPLRGGITRQGAILNGLGNPALAQYPMGVILPSIVLSAVAICLFFEIKINTFLLLLINVFGALLALALSYSILKGKLKRFNLSSYSTKYSTSVWVKSLLPFTLMTVVITLNTEFASLILGYFVKVEEVGFFKLAVQGTLIITLGLSSLNAVIMPEVSRSYASKEYYKFAVLVQRAVRINAISTLFTIIGTIAFSKFAIQLFFGDEFLPVYPILIVLSIGHLSSVIFGCSNVILTMTGYEVYALRSLIISVSLSVVLMLILVPTHSGLGAAIAVSAGQITANLFLARTVYKKLGIKSYPSLSQGKN